MYNVMSCRMDLRKQLNRLQVTHIMYHDKDPSICCSNLFHFKTTKHIHLPSSDTFTLFIEQRKFNSLSFVSMLYLFKDDIE